MPKFSPFVLLFAAIAAPAQEQSPLGKLIDSASPSIVTVRVVAEIELPPMMGGEKQEMRQEALGTVVDKSGLVMVPTSALDPGAHMNRMFGGEAEVTSSVTSIKIVIGNEAKELTGTVVAKDEKLGLSYVRISDLGDRQLAPLAFEQKGDLSVGMSVYAVRRLAEGYDFAPFARRIEVSGRIKKPRNAWLLAEGLDTGSPVFAADGALCGVVVHIDAGEKADGQSMMMRMLGGGGGGAETFVVGPQVVANSIAQAVEAAGKAEQQKPADGKGEASKDAKKDEKGG